MLSCRSVNRVCPAVRCATIPGPRSHGGVRDPGIQERNPDRAADLPAQIQQRRPGGNLRAFEARKRRQRQRDKQAADPKTRRHQGQSGSPGCRWPPSDAPKATILLRRPQGR